MSHSLSFSFKKFRNEFEKFKAISIFLHITTKYRGAMKFSELPISTIQEIKDLDAYMICNTVDHDNESVSNISKSLVHISNFAQKDEVNALVEQNAKLVEIVTTLVNKSNILEAELDKLKNQPAKAFGEGMEEINNQLEELKHRLDENLVEC